MTALDTPTGKGMGSRVNVSGIFGVPGEERAIVDELVLSDVELSLGSVHESVQLDLRLEGVLEGVVAVGTIRAVAEVPCSRCLTELRRELQIRVAELFSDDPDLLDADEAYPVDGLEIDIEQLVRDVVILALPDLARCESGPEGTCESLADVLGDTVTLGVEGDDEGDGAKIDPRWEALDSLFDDTDKEQ